MDYGRKEGKEIIGIYIDNSGGMQRAGRTELLLWCWNDGDIIKQTFTVGCQQVNQI